MSFVLFSLFAVAFARSPERTLANALVRQMTFDQKFSLLHGWASPYVGSTNPISLPNVTIPAFTYEDGPQGVADGTHFATAWPSALTVAATFDRDLFVAFGQAMGQEQRAKGVAVMLGPMVNLARVPVHGRAYESCGEDAVLCAAYGVGVVKGVQSVGIAANIKHLVANNQELNRTLTTAIIDERTLHQLYLKSFRAAVDAGVLTAMCSYNRISINGLAAYACEHPYTLAVMKEGWDDGFIMSDWGATHSAGAALMAGLDQEMPFGVFLNSFLLNHTAYYARIDDAAERILTVMIKLNLIKAPLTGNLGVNARSAAHDKLARQLAADSVVLLKNQNGLLPLSPGIGILMVGDDCNKTATQYSSGGGSGHVCCNDVVTPLQSVLAQSPGTRYLDSSTPLATISKAAGAANVVVVCAVSWSQEGEDRKSTRLSAADEQMINAASAGNPNTVALIHSTGAIDSTRFVNNVGALLAAWMPGVVDGSSFTDILFGRTSPGGRLPVTWASRLPFNSTAQYPGINNQANYSEGLFVGYRWFAAFDTNSVQFPFGFGLSYSSFAHSSLSVSKAANVLTFTAKITNTGSVVADDVPQVYVQFPAGLGEPEWQLLTFTRVRNVKPGTSSTISLQVNILKEITVWDVATHQFFTPSGRYCFSLASHAFDTGNGKKQCITL
jgi:beta-glucosidase